MNLSDYDFSAAGDDYADSLDAGGHFARHIVVFSRVGCLTSGALTATVGETVLMILASRH
jgi:hypothetical protein